METVLAPLRSSDFEKYYEIDYASAAPAANEYSDMYKANYKPERQQRMVQRIAKCRLDGKSFVDGMKHVTAVLPLTQHRVESSEHNQALRVVHRGQICVPGV